MVGEFLFLVTKSLKSQHLDPLLNHEIRFQNFYFSSRNWRKLQISRFFLQKYSFSSRTMPWISAASIIFISVVIVILQLHIVTQEIYEYENYSIQFQPSSIPQAGQFVQFLSQWSPPDSSMTPQETVSSSPSLFKYCKLIRKYI